MIKELTNIEDELDRYLENEASQYNKYMGSLLSSQDVKAPDREQVFELTLQLNKEITGLRKEVDATSKQIQQTEQSHQEAASSYVIQSSLDENLRRNVSLRQALTFEQPLKEAEDSLGKVYSSLKLIQTSAVNLKFQLDDITRSIAEK